MEDHHLLVGCVFSALRVIPDMVQRIQFPQVGEVRVDFYDHLLCDVFFQAHSVFINIKEGGVTHGRDGNYESGCQQR